MEQVKPPDVPLALLEGQQCPQVLLNGSGDVHHQQRVVVAGVPGEEVPAGRIQVAQRAPGVPRHVEDLQSAAAQVQLVPRLEGHKLHRAVRHKGGRLRRLPRGKLPPHIAHPGGQRAAVQHGDVRRVDVAAAELKHAPGVVHVAVGQGHLHGQIRQGGHKRRQAPQACHGVDEQRLVPAFHQEAVHPRKVGDFRHPIGQPLGGKVLGILHANSSFSHDIFIILLLPGPRKREIPTGRGFGAEVSPPGKNIPLCPLDKLPV